MALGNTAFGNDGLIATTLQHYNKKLEDVVFGSNPLTYVLKKAGIPSQNGRTIVMPLLYAQATASGSYADADTFVAPVREGITAAEFPWKAMFASIFFTGIEMAQNSGPEQAVSLLKARVTQAERTIAKKLNAMLFADGTGNGGKDLMGLAGAIADGNTYGGIDRSDALNAWWDANVTALGGAMTLAALRTMYNNCSEGNEQPTHISTTQALFEKYESLLDAGVRYENRDLGDAGFQNLMFKGAPIFFDRDNQSGIVYFINTNHLKIVSLDGRWFDWSEWLVPVNQDAKYKNVYLNGNLTSSNSKRLGKLTGVT
jgi:hypothetical protein